MNLNFYSSTLVYLFSKGNMKLFKKTDNLISMVVKISLINLLIMSLLIFTGLSFSQAQEESSEAREVLEAQYTLGSGDRIKITVYGEEELSGEFQVDGSGNISYPLVGEVQVKGLSLPQLEQRLVESLQDGYLVNPKISLEVLNYRPFYILGEVNNPGKYEYISGINLYNAVAMAGGYTYRARQNSAEIARSNPEMKIRDADHSTLILPGDIINIRQRFF